MIGAFPIGEPKPPIVLSVLREIERRGAIKTAKRVRQRISGVFVFAIAKGIVQSDPAEKLGAVLKPLRKGRQPAITDLNPLRAMIKAAEEDYARPGTRLALRLLALTAVRPSELRGAQWVEFEELNGVPRRRELACTWADLLSVGLPEPAVLVERPAKALGPHSRRRLPAPVHAEFRSPRLTSAA